MSSFSCLFTRCRRRRRCRPIFALVSPSMLFYFRIAKMVKNTSQLTLIILNIIL